MGTTCANRSGAVYTAGYDPWGNQTSRSTGGVTGTLSYDVLNRLTSWNAGANSQENYVYDATGNRILKRSLTGTGTTLAIYSFGLEEDDYTGNGVLSNQLHYYNLAGHLIGSFDGTRTTYYLTDGLDSVLTSFSQSAIQGEQVYGPYGASRYQSGTITTARGYTGQVHDPVSGLDYYVARYYDPVLGQFLSIDSVQGNQQGMNPYQYVGDNPETHNDPSGHCWPLCTALIGAAVGAIIGAAVTTVTSVATTGKLPSLRSVLQSAAAGAVSGAIIGVTGPGAGVAAAVGIGALSGGIGGAAGQVVGNAVSGKGWSHLGDGVLQAGLEGAVTGAATGGLLKGGGLLLNRFAGRALSGFTATLVDGVRSLSTRVGNFTGMSGSTLRELTARLPSSAAEEPFNPTAAITRGLKFAWNDSQGNRCVFYCHSSNAKASAGSNSALGWTYRFIRYVGKTTGYMEDNGNFLWGSSGNFSNSTHLPMLTPSSLSERSC